jgi:hypothetical protein
MRCASNGTCGVRAARGDDVGPDGQVRDEDAVHDVPLDPVHAGLLERRHLLAEAGEVGWQHRRHDLDRTGHDPPRYVRSPGWETP